MNARYLGLCVLVFFLAGCSQSAQETVQSFDVSLNEQRVAFDSQGEVWISDLGNPSIRVGFGWAPMFYNDSLVFYATSAGISVHHLDRGTEELIIPTSSTVLDFVLLKNGTALGTVTSQLGKVDFELFSAGETSVRLLMSNFSEAAGMTLGADGSVYFQECHSWFCDEGQDLMAIDPRNGGVRVAWAPNFTFHIACRWGENLLLFSPATRTSIAAFWEFNTTSQAADRLSAPVGVGAFLDGCLLPGKRGMVAIDLVDDGTMLSPRESHLMYLDLQSGKSHQVSAGHPK